MAHVIPVAITSRETLPPPADPVGEVFAVTAAGAVVRLLQRFPITGGAGVYSGPGLPEILTTRLRATLPPPLELSRVELGVDTEGRYVVAAWGRLPLPARRLPFVYERPLRLRGGLHPGRARQAVVARPEGPARMRGANLRPFAAALDAAIAAAAEEQLAEVARHIARLSALAAGLAYTPTRVSVASVALGPTGQEFPAVSATFRFSPGAITGGVVPADPPEPPVAARLSHDVDHDGGARSQLHARRRFLADDDPASLGTLEAWWRCLDPRDESNVPQCGDRIFAAESSHVGNVDSFRRFRGTRTGGRWRGLTVAAAPAREHTHSSQ